MPERTGRKVYILLTEDLADLCLSALVAKNRFFWLKKWNFDDLCLSALVAKYTFF